MGNPPQWGNGMSRRVVITGMAGICPLGTDWQTIRAAILARQSGIRQMPGWDALHGLQTRLGAPVLDFEEDREDLPSMGRVSLLALDATNRALASAGLKKSQISDPRIGLAYGSTSGSIPALQVYMAHIHRDADMAGLSPDVFTQAVADTCAINMAHHFDIQGRVISTCSACTSGSQGIGSAFEAIVSGVQEVMVAGGAEQLHVMASAVFDILFATSTRNDSPETTPRPFDAERDGLVVGEGAASLVLESLEHAQARGAEIFGELVGYASNCDGTHVVNPSPEGMERVMKLALSEARIEPEAIAYVNAHGTATSVGDIAESQATAAVFGNKMPISSLKSYMGHTLGACGAIEAWLGLEMLQEGWMPPTINLEQVDPKCATLDYLVEPRECTGDYVMSNNFAFGGVNTSLVFKKWTH